MKTLSIFTISALAVGLFIFAATRQASTQPQSQWPARNTSEEGIWITVQPVDLTSSTWSFRVMLTTHSGSLDQDLTKLAVLTDDKGKTYTPARWDGTPTGGHHRQGVLTFQAPSPKPKTATLTIKDVAGTDRKFSWNIQ